MNLDDIIAMASQTGALAQVGRQFGLDERQTAAALSTLAPVVAAGIRRNMADPRGVVSLIDALGRGNHARYVEDPDALQYDNVRNEGNGILGHIFGSKDVSRGVAMQAASSSGIGAAILKKLLPVIASMVLGSLAKNMGGGGSPSPRGGGLGDILGDILGGGQRRSAPAPRPRSPQGGGTLDDLLRDMLGGGGRQRPKYSTEQPDFDYDEEAVKRGRHELEDALGGGTSTGNAADDLLNSVERHLGRR